MEIYITCQDDSSTLHELRIVKKIGKGRFSVYHAYLNSHQQHFALKVFPATFNGTQQYKRELLCSNLSHLNVIKYISLRCISTDICSFATEFAEHGDFLAFIIKNGPMKTETLVRTYFHQLVEGLEHIHSQGMAHLDLKLENIVFGNNFELKIIDFDQAQLITEPYITSAGTENYRAPEIIRNKCKNPAVADVYSIGVILFSLMTGKYPFAEKKNPKGVSLYPYAAFIQNNRKFWEHKAKLFKGEKTLSEDLIELLNGMLEYEADKRVTIHKIKDSKWYKGAVLDRKSLKTEMKNIIGYVTAEKGKDKNHF